MYNHMTKDSRTMLNNDDNLVIREENFDDDAFTKARKEDTNDNVKQKEFHNKIAERRNKVAVTKENVDKEYRDTLAFLNSLPKDMSDKPIVSMLHFLCNYHYYSRNVCKNNSMFFNSPFNWKNNYLNPGSFKVIFLKTSNLSRFISIENVWFIIIM